MEPKEIASAPRNGDEIIGVYDVGTKAEEICEIYWQEDGRCCMLGPRAGSHPPGWSDVENNLPVDEPSHWLPICEAYVKALREVE